MKANMMNRSGFGSCMKWKHQLVIKQKVTFSSHLHLGKYGATLWRRWAFAWKKGHDTKTRSKRGRRENLVRSEPDLPWKYFCVDTASGEVWETCPQGYGGNSVDSRVFTQDLLNATTAPLAARHQTTLQLQTEPEVPCFLLNCWSHTESQPRNTRARGSRFPGAAPCSQPLDPPAFISTRGILQLPFYDPFFTTTGWGWAARLRVPVIMRTIRAEQLLITQSSDPLKQILINHKTYVFLLNSRDNVWKQMEELRSQIKFDGPFKNKLSLAGLSSFN